MCCLRVELTIRREEAFPKRVNLMQRYVRWRIVTAPFVHMRTDVVIAEPIKA